MDEFSYEVVSQAEDPTAEEIMLGLERRLRNLKENKDELMAATDDFYDSHEVGQ